MVSTHRLYARYSRGVAGAGIETDALIGGFLKAIVDNGNNTYNVTTQQADGSETTVTVSATGGSGASITSGTADPTGGSAGDAYLQVNASDVITSIWRNVNGTWTEFTLPAGGGGSITDAALDVVDPSNESTTAGASRQSISEAFRDLGGVIRHPTATYDAGATRITLTEAANDAIAVGDLATFQIPPGVAGSDEIVIRIGTGASQAIVDLAGAAVEAQQFTVASRVVLLRRTLNWIVLVPDVNASDGGLTTAEVNALIAGNLTDTPLDTDDPQSESTTAAASRQAITEAIASLGGELGAVGPFHFRINQDATQTDSQAAHTLGGIYQNTSGRPLRVREAFVPVHPGGSGATEYNFYVWKVNRASATSYMTDVAAGASESLRTTADGTTIGHDVARGVQSTLHGFTRAEVIIAPGEYFMVVVYRSVNGTAANTIVASGADVSQDYDGALEYVAKASFAGTYGTDPVEVYHNSTFAERMQLIFTFEDEGLLPPIHGIHREEIPDGRDRFPFSDEGEATNPNAYIEWDDLLVLIRNVFVYERSRPQASADNLHDLAISAIDRSADLCINVPNRSAEATGTWAAITPGTAIEYPRVRSDVTAPVEGRFYYEYFEDDFWFGTDVGGGTVQLLQDVADDALASFLTSSSNAVLWLHHHATDAEALVALPALPTGHEVFYWNTADLAIKKLDNSTYAAAGSVTTGDHYQWVQLFGGDGDGGGGGDTPAVALFEGPDTPATYVPNVAARPNFRALVLSRAPMENRSLQIEIEVNTNTNTTANPTPTGAVTIFTSDHIETNHLVGDDALPVLAGAQLTTFSSSGNQGPSVGNTTGSKIARGNENDANDFGHSNIWIGHGLNADGDFVLYVAHSHWGGIPAHIIRVMERSFGGGTADSTQETGGGQRRVARSVISSGTHLAITPRTFNLATGTPGFAFSAVSIDDVPIADLDSFSATIRIGDRAGFTMYLSREQIQYAQNQNSTVWEFTDANNYTGGSVIPCLFLEGKHNTDNYMRTSIKPTRSQVGYIAGSNDGLTGVLIFFVYDPSNENINHVWTVAFSDEDVEVEEMHFHYLEDA